MSKTTRELVFDAADALLKEGIRPSQQNIRERIGKGSATTIHKALAEWWGNLSVRLQHGAASEQAPEFLQRSIVEIWSRAQEFANTQLADQQRRMETLLQTERHELEALAADAKQRSESIAASLDKAYQRTEVLQEALQDAREENIGLERRLIGEASMRAEMEREIKSQERVIAKLQASLSLAPEGRQQDSELAEENVNLKAAIAALDKKLAAKDSALAEQQQSVLADRRRMQRREDELKRDWECKRVVFEQQIKAKDQEIQRLLALLPDKR